MFISKLESNRRSLLFTGIIDLVVSFVCWIFSAIYIACGHGKTSGAMVCLIIPFFLLGMVFIILSLTGAYKFLTLSVRCLLNFSVSSFTVAMALVGIFEIAGVPQSFFLIPIWVGGGFFALCGIAVMIFNIFRKVLEEI